MNTTPGVHNKCFFGGISIALFGTPCFAISSNTDASHGLGIRTLDIKHPLLHVWTEDLEEVGQTEEARQAMHFHLAKLAAGMVQALDFPIVLVWALADLWVDVTVIPDAFVIEDVTDFLSGSSTLQNLQCGDLLQPIWQTLGFPADFPDPEVPGVPQILLIHDGYHFSAADWDNLFSRGIVSLRNTIDLTDNKGTRRKNFLPVFLTIIADDNYKAQDRATHPTQGYKPHSSMLAPTTEQDRRTNLPQGHKPHPSLLASIPGLRKEPNHDHPPAASPQTQQHHNTRYTNTPTAKDPWTHTAETQRTRQHCPATMSTYSSTNKPKQSFANTDRPSMFPPHRGPTDTPLPAPGPPEPKFYTGIKPHSKQRFADRPPDIKQDIVRQWNTYKGDKAQDRETRGREGHGYNKPTNWSQQQYDSPSNANRGSRTTPFPQFRDRNKKPRQQTQRTGTRTHLETPVHNHSQTTRDKQQHTPYSCKTDFDTTGDESPGGRAFITRCAEYQVQINNEQHNTGGWDPPPPPVHRRLFAPSAQRASVSETRKQLLADQQQYFPTGPQTRPSRTYPQRSWNTEHDSLSTPPRQDATREDWHTVSQELPSQARSQRQRMEQQSSRPNPCRLGQARPQITHSLDWTRRLHPTAGQPQ